MKRTIISISGIIIASISIAIICAVTLIIDIFNYGYFSGLQDVGIVKQRIESDLSIGQADISEVHEYIQRIIVHPDWEFCTEFSERYSAIYCHLYAQRPSFWGAWMYRVVFYFADDSLSDVEVTKTWIGV